MYYNEMVRLEQTCGLRSRQCTEYIMHNYLKIYEDALTMKPMKDYIYMLTFTVDPQKVPNMSDNAVQQKIEDYIVKVLRNKTATAWIVKEHKDSNVHWHCAIQTDGPFDQKHINYYRKTYGHVDVSRTRTETLENSLKYMKKESEPTKIK